MLVEPRSQPLVPPVGLPALSGWPCLPPSSLLMPLIVKLSGKQEVVQGSLYWMTQPLVGKGFKAVSFLVLKHDSLMKWFFVLKGAFWLFADFVVDLGIEGFVRVGFVATLSVLLFVSCSGLGFAFSGLGPSGWCRRARAFALRCAPSFQSSSFSCAAMPAAILSFDFSEVFRNSKVVLEGLDENLVVLKDLMRTWSFCIKCGARTMRQLRVPSLRSKAAALILRFSWRLKKGLLFSGEKRRMKKNERMKEKKRNRRGRKRERKKEGFEPLLW